MTEVTLRRAVQLLKGIIFCASFQDTNISHSFSLTCILIKSNSYFDDDDSKR